MPRRETRKQVLEKAVASGDWQRWDAIKHQSPGGWRKRHGPLRKARNHALKRGHLLGKFQSGETLHGPEDGDPDTYAATCRLCGETAIVSVTDGVATESGFALEKDCRETRG